VSGKDVADFFDFAFEKARRLFGVFVFAALGDVAELFGLIDAFCDFCAPLGL